MQFGQHLKGDRSANYGLCAGRDIWNATWRCSGYNLGFRGRNRFRCGNYQIRDAS
jgi:hypothetical protein